MTNLIIADKIAIGANQASAVYVGSTKVWPPFKPTDLSGCAVWLDAATITGVANGGSLSSWTNKGNVSSPGAAIFDGSAPTLRTNALNTIMPCVRTVSPSRIRFTATQVDVDYTFAYVARKWSAVVGRIFSSNWSIAGNPNTLYGFWGDRFDCAHVEAWLTPDVVVTATTAWKLYSGDASSSTVPRMFTNGTLLMSGSAPIAKGFGSNLLLGGWSNDALEIPDGEYAEVVQYNRKLTDVERQKVEQYLRIKWNM